jgi:hypothetical protein
MSARVPYYVGAIAAAATLVGVGYASCGSRGGDADRSAEAVGRGDNERSEATAVASGSTPDDPAQNQGPAKGNRGPSDGNAQADSQATNAPGSRSQQGTPGGAVIDGGASSPPTSNAASGTPVVLKPGLTPGASVGGLEFRYPSGARGPCGCEQSDVCVRSTTGVGAVVDLCLPRPKDCDPVSCGCFSPSPCGSKRQQCSDNDAKMGILNCSTRRGAP